MATLVAGPTKRDSPSYGVSYHAKSCVVQGELHRERCLLDTGRPPGVYSQAPGNRDSARVKPHNCGTCGTEMDTEVNQNKHEAVLQGVATLCSERPKESKTDDLGKGPAKAQPQESRTKGGAEPVI